MSSHSEPIQKIKRAMVQITVTLHHSRMVWHVKKTKKERRIGLVGPRVIDWMDWAGIGILHAYRCCGVQVSREVLESVRESKDTSATQFKLLLAAPKTPYSASASV